jgi:hypothetical protein
METYTIPNPELLTLDRQNNQYSHITHTIFLPEIKNSIPQWDIKVNIALATAETWAYKRPHAQG